MNLRNRKVVNIDEQEKDARIDAFTYNSQESIEGVNIDWASDTIDIFVGDEEVCLYPGDVERMIKCLQKAKAEFNRVRNQNGDCVECSM